MAEGAPGTVVFTFSIETWDDAVRREFCRPPDQTVLALARHPRVERLVCVDAWRSLPVEVYRRRPLASRSIVEVEGRRVERLRPRRLRHVESHRVATVQRAYQRYAQRIGRICDLGRDEATLVTFHPFVAAWASRAPWVRNTIYVGRDDWASSPREERWWPVYRQAYADLERPDVDIFAVSEELAQRLSPRARVVPNGVDERLWSKDLEEPAVLHRIRRPVAVYTGTIDARLNLEWLRVATEEVGTVVLAGVVPDTELRRDLEALPGVVLAGELSQRELAALVQHSDLGLLPHHSTPLTRAMSPLKLYEYLAGGLPVAASDLPPVRGTHPLVRTASTAEEWRAVVRDRARHPRAAASTREAVLREVSWTRRLQPVADAALREPDVGPSVPRSRRRR